jgi:hypothetical protein
MNNPLASTRNPWPYAILAWFVIFTSAMAAWVTVAVRQKMDLVRSDYYEEEVHFQSQLDRLNRTAAIRGTVAIRYDATRSGVTIDLPGAHLEPRPTGRIQFYRPSDASLDVEVPLALEVTGEQHIDVGMLRGGQWKIRVQWNVAAQEYFFEQTMVFDEARRDPATPSTRTK